MNYDIILLVTFEPCNCKMDRYKTHDANERDQNLYCNKVFNCLRSYSMYKLFMACQQGAFLLPAKCLQPVTLDTGRWGCQIIDKSGWRT